MSITAKNLDTNEYFYGHKACAGCGGADKEEKAADQKSGLDAQTDEWAEASERLEEISGEDV